MENEILFDGVTRQSEKHKFGSLSELRNSRRNKVGTDTTSVTPDTAPKIHSFMEEIWIQILFSKFKPYLNTLGFGVTSTKNCPRKTSTIEVYHSSDSKTTRHNGIHNYYPLGPLPSSDDQI